MHYHHRLISHITKQERHIVCSKQYSSHELEIQNPHVLDCLCVCMCEFGLKTSCLAFVRLCNSPATLTIVCRVKFSLKTFLECAIFFVAEQEKSWKRKLMHL